MARRKFGGYTIDYKKLNVKKQPTEGTITCKVQLSGNIEIGIDIDDWTWRGDWLTKMLFKDNPNNYRLKSVQNNYTAYSPDEVNVVTAVYEI